MRIMIFSNVTVRTLGIHIKITVLLFVLSINSLYAINVYNIFIQRDALKAESSVLICFKTLVMCV